MDIQCSWCTQTYVVDDRKARKKISKHGFFRTKCSNCKTINVISGASPVMASDAVQEHPAIASAFRTRWLSSIQFQLTTILLLVIASIIGTFLLYNYTSTKSRIENDLVQFARHTSDQLAKYLVTPLWGVEIGQIRDALASEMLAKQVYAIHIIDNDKKGVLVGMQRDAGWEISPSQQNISGEFITAEKDIVYKDEPIGKVRLWVTPRFMKKELNRSTLNLVITTLVLFGAIVASVFLTLHKVVVHPITALTAAADRMSRGELNTSIEIRSKNEIGSLVNALVRMQTSLVLSFKRLQEKKGSK